MSGQARPRDFSGPARRYLHRWQRAGASVRWVHTQQLGKPQATLDGKLPL